MHTILNVEADGSASQNDETLEKRLVKTCLGSLFVHDDRSELLMVTYQHYLLASKNQRNHAFWLCGLCGLIDEYSPKLGFGNTWIARTNASATDHIRIG